MFWTVLIIILLCAICGVFWLHRKQEREWQHELARLERGMQEGKYIPNGQDADSPHQFSEDAKAAYGKTIARLRLMAARYTPQQEQLSEQPANTENEESETGMEDIADFFESQEAKHEYHQDADIERSSENPSAEQVPQAEPPQQHAAERKDTKPKSLNIFPVSLKTKALKKSLWKRQPVRSMKQRYRNGKSSRPSAILQATGITMTGKSNSSAHR